jgi:SAM-dependent methyltransferase
LAIDIIKKNLNWRTIWGSRKLENQETGTDLEKLIALDGFDSPLGLMSEGNWRSYAEEFLRRNEFKSGETLFEVGCGSGALLYLFHELGYKVSGLDFSQKLINAARLALPIKSDYLIFAEANMCPVDVKADIVMANHVFHYFESFEYASEVLNKMIDKASRLVAIYGIPNVDLKKESESMRRGLLSVEEYNKKYCGLDILYFSKNWFRQIAMDRGYCAMFYDHKMPGFAQNEFRFDCVIKL